MFNCLEYLLIVCVIYIFIKKMLFISTLSLKNVTKYSIINIKH